MYANVQLRAHTSPEPDQYEWQVVDEFGWIVFRSPNRTEASWWIHIEGGLTDYTYTLKRVRVVKRDPLSTHAKAALELVVEKHGPAAKINCIKEVRAVYGLGLKEAKDLVEDYFEEN